MAFWSTYDSGGNAQVSIIIGLFYNFNYSLRITLDAKIL
jgi:hypothetical protein